MTLTVTSLATLTNDNSNVGVFIGTKLYSFFSLFFSCADEGDRGLIVGEK